MKPLRSLRLTHNLTGKAYKYLQCSNTCVNALLAKEMQAMFDYVRVFDNIHTDTAGKVFDYLLN